MSARSETTIGAVVSAMLIPIFILLGLVTSCQAITHHDPDSLRVETGPTL